MVGDGGAFQGTQRGIHSPIRHQGRYLPSELEEPLGVRHSVIQEESDSQLVSQAESFSKSVSWEESVSHSVRRIQSGSQTGRHSWSVSKSVR